MPDGPSDVAAVLERVYRADGGAALAWLIRVTGDFDLADDAMQEALTAALERWPLDGVPESPVAWLRAVARNKARDRARRRRTAAARLADLQHDVGNAWMRKSEVPEVDEPLPDDQLRLVFTCCHPALSVEAQIALTLRTLAGLSTDQIARAFLVPSATIGQRIVRAKRKISGAGIPFRAPDRAEIPARLPAVLVVIYLIFNAGFDASGSTESRSLAAESIRLARLLRHLLPQEPEVAGLLALLLLHDARREARRSGDGDLVLLANQDRTRWNSAQIREGSEILDEAMRRGDVGIYQVQAAIAACHARAADPESTDWEQILSLYDLLHRLMPSPVVALNRIVAVGMVRGPQDALAELDSSAWIDSLADYLYLHSTRADLLRRAGRPGEAARAYRRALDLASEEAEKRFLLRRITECEKQRDPGMP